MPLVPNGRMRVQEKQSLLRNGLFSFAQAKQQKAQQQPKVDPRVQIEQQQIGNDGQQPAGGQNPQQAAPAPADPTSNPEDPTMGQDKVPGQPPAANMDVMQDRVQEQAEGAVADGSTPQKGGDAKNGLVQFTKEMVMKVMGIPFRKLEQMGGFVNFKSDSQHNDKVDLKFPNWYWGRPELGEVSKEHKMQIIKAAQDAFNLFYEGSNGDDDTFTMSFSTVDPRQGMETAHDARLKRTYKALAQPNQGKPGASGKAASSDSDMIKLAFTVSSKQEMAYDQMLNKIYHVEKSSTASTIGELIKGRRDELFDIMRKIAQGSK